MPMRLGAFDVLIESLRQRRGREEKEKVAEAGCAALRSLSTKVTAGSNHDETRIMLPACRSYLRNNASSTFRRIFDFRHFAHFTTFIIFYEFLKKYLIFRINAYVSKKERQGGREREEE